MNKLAVCKVDSFIHPSGSPDGTLVVQVSWMRLDALLPAQGKATLTLVASHDFAGDVADAMATTLAIPARKVLVLGV